jgi:phosphoglycerol transferase MdoB-like AlkP superfamily enzyme
MYYFTSRLKFWVTCLLYFIIIQNILRVALTIWTSQGHPEHLISIFTSFPLALAYDIAICILMGMPFLLGLSGLQKFWHKTLFHWGAHFLLLCMCLLIVFVTVSEVFFWNEFDSRFNAIAVNYLLFPREVIGNIYQSFDLVVILPVICAGAVALYLILRQKLNIALDDKTTRGELRLIFAIFVLATGLASGFLFLKGMPSNESRIVNEITSNGFHSFFRAALTNDSHYDGLYPGMEEGRALQIVRETISQDNTRFLRPVTDYSLLRHVDNGNKARRLNVVLVIEESFGSSYVDGLDNRNTYNDELGEEQRESISPKLTRLAEDGLFFTNIYATGNRTVRGLEAILTSFPPIPGISTSRRPGSKGMNSLAFLLKNYGYQTSFLYGGRAAFDNMGAFWKSTGFDDVLDQNDILQKPFTTIWGAADEYLFTEALRRMDKKTANGKPVFLSLLTVSNHRPFTFPKGRIAKNPEQKRKENAASYADWAFGYFLDRAQSHSWFDNTIFIFIGDHGPRIYGAAYVPVSNFRVPLLFYAPKHLQPERNDTLGSSIDVIPTLLGLLNISYDSPFFGLDLLRVPKGKGRVLMSHNFAVAYADGKSVATLIPGNPSKGYDMKIGRHKAVPAKNGININVLDKAIATYQTAHRMFYRGLYHELGKSKAP